MSEQSAGLRRNPPQLPRTQQPRAWGLLVSWKAQRRGTEQVSPLPPIPQTKQKPPGGRAGPACGTGGTHF